jgi:uncharacterized membrane protein
MLKAMRKSIPLWLGITAFLTFWEYLFTYENMMRFLDQFIIVALVGILIVVLQNYLVDWVYERSGGRFKSITFRIILYSVINTIALYIVLSGIVLLDTQRTILDYSRVYMRSGLIVLVITAAHVIYCEYKYKYCLQKKQKNFNS